MITNPSGLAPSVASASQPNAARKLKGFALLSLLLIACFARPLYSLIRFALHSDLYSYIVLIPFVSVYLLWLERKNLANPQFQRRWFALLPLLGGLALLLAYWSPVQFGTSFPAQDYLAFMTASFLCLCIGTYLLLLGFSNLRSVSFPFSFLVFMIPFPVSLEHAIENFLQQGSASAACLLFKLFGMPVFKQGMELNLPGFAMKVAPQCSGIHSSLVLFIISLVAGYLLLRAKWARSIFALAVIPLAMLRNGFRIFVLGELCVQVDPSWIDSDLHHRGGPLFFALSLIPFFLLLLLLRKLESKNQRALSLTPRFSAVARHTEDNLTLLTVSPVKLQSSDYSSTAPLNSHEKSYP